MSSNWSSVPFPTKAKENVVTSRFLSWVETPFSLNLSAPIFVVLSKKPSLSPGPKVFLGTETNYFLANVCARSVFEMKAQLLVTMIRSIYIMRAHIKTD